MPESLNRDPSQFFVGGEFAQDMKDFPVRAGTVRGVATRSGPYEVLIRDGLLGEYYKRSNNLINSGDINPPTVHFDKRTGLILNPGRAQRPQGGEAIIPIVPGNEHLTPPPLLVIRKRKEKDSMDRYTRIDSNDWLIRLFPNAFAYGYPRREVLEEKGSRRIETVCALSLVAALNPEKQPLHDIWGANEELMELWLYTLAVTSNLIKSQGDYLYLDKGMEERRRFDAVLGFINQGKEAGGSLPWPHAQIIALPRENAQPLYSGDEVDENGNCGRCVGSREKIEKEDPRIIKQTENVLVYAPWSDGASKGQVVRITPTFERHFPSFDKALGDVPTFRDLARFTHRSMYQLSKQQRGDEWQKAAMNVVFAQDIVGDTSHLFIDVRTGIPNGGFGIVTPVYRGVDSVIKPDVIYQDPIDTALEFRKSDWL